MIDKMRVSESKMILSKIMNDTKLITSDLWKFEVGFDVVGQ